MNAATSEAAAAGSKPLTLKELHSRMALIRAFETRVTELYRDGDIPGFVHTSLGQEAVAVGSARRCATTTTWPPPTAATATAWPRARTSTA